MLYLKEKKLGRDWILLKVFWLRDEINANEGSKAFYNDLTKSLIFGPKSAGTKPGLAGGRGPTIPDANRILGYFTFKIIQKRYLTEYHCSKRSYEKKLQYLRHRYTIRSQL